MKITKKIIIIIVCILAIIAGIITTYYPDAEERTTEFSYENAKENLKVIAKEPHSSKFHQQALKDVREYIIGELEKSAMKPEVFTYKNVENDKGETADLNNIYSKIDGKNGEEGSYILLCAHYDSAGSNPQNDDGYSYGACDDGYGVAAILEILREVKNSGRELENGIKVLITDGEEMHLIGSREELNNNFDLYKNVSYVINFEARGTSGPVIMFQTSENNGRVLDLYKNADYPITSSLFSDLYKDSGRSDFLNIKDKGLSGINFTTLDNVEYYHTQYDCYENICDKSLKHYGDQAMPIVEEFIYNDKYSDLNYFKEEKDKVFFTALPNCIVDYSITAGKICFGVLIIAAVLVIFYNRKIIKGILKSMLVNLIQIISVSIIGLIISYILALVSGVNFTLNHMGKVPGDDILVWILPAILFLAILKIEMKSEDSAQELLLGGVLLQIILLTASIVFLPGASYLMMIPLILTFIAEAVIRITNNEKWRYFLLMPVSSIIILYMPLISILNMAFSIGSLPFIAVMIILMKSLISPLVKELLH